MYEVACSINQESTIKCERYAGKIDAQRAGGSSVIYGVYIAKIDGPRAANGTEVRFHVRNVAAHRHFDCIARPSGTLRALEDNVLAWTYCSADPVLNSDSLPGEVPAYTTYGVGIQQSVCVRRCTSSSWHPNDVTKISRAVRFTDFILGEDGVYLSWPHLLICAILIGIESIDTRPDERQARIAYAWI